MPYTNHYSEDKIVFKLQVDCVCYGKCMHLYPIHVSSSEQTRCHGTRLIYLSCLDDTGQSCMVKKKELKQLLYVYVSMCAPKHFNIVVHVH